MWWAGEIAQQSKHLLRKGKDLGSIPFTACHAGPRSLGMPCWPPKLGMAVQAYNPGAREAETEGSLRFYAVQQTNKQTNKYIF